MSRTVSTAVTTDLLPCPFCGGEASRRVRKDEDLSTHNIVDWHKIGCDECEVYFEMPLGYIDADPVERWNRRTALNRIEAPINCEGFL